MIRLAFFIAIASAWTAVLVVVGAYAGWTFVAMKQVGVASLSDTALATIEPALLSRYVGGQITRIPFEAVNITSIFLPAILASLIGGRALKSQQVGSMLWLHRGVLVVLAAAIWCAFVSVQLGFKLNDASEQYWTAVVAHDASATSIAKDALDAVHGRAQSTYLSLVGLATLSTVLGATLLTRRSALISRHEQQ